MRTLNRLGVLGVLLLGATASAYSQNHEVIHSHIPFSFYAGTKQLPAGEYTFDLQPGGGVVMVRDEEGRGVAILQGDITERSAGADKTDVVFTKIGKDYFLSDCWAAGETSGLHMPESKLERSERLTAANAQHQIVAVHKSGS